MNKLELLSLSNKFEVKKTDNGYDVEHNECNLSAYITHDKKVTYYVGGCYNSGSEYVEFDIDYLDQLREFCNLMIKE